MSKLLKDTEFEATVRKFVKDIESSIGDPFYTVRVEAIEVERRDGYIPHSYNRGGYKVVCFADLRGFFSTGAHHGTHAEGLVEALIERDRAFTISHGDLVEGDEASEDEWLENLGDETNSVYLEVMCMYHGVDENGIHSMEINAYIEGSDAPYHRGADLRFETEVTWRTNSGLERKLKAVKHKLNKFCLDEGGDDKDFKVNKDRKIYGYNISPFKSEGGAE